MRKKIFNLLIILSLWAQWLIPAYASFVDNTSEVRLSAVSGNPFPAQTQTAVSSLSINSGPIKLYQNGVWVPYQYGGQTISVASDVGMLHDVFIKPGTSPGSLTYEDDPQAASATTGTISSATAASPCVLTLTASPAAGFVAGAQIMVAQGTGTGTLYTDGTYGLSGSRNNIFTIASVSGSTITLTGTNTSNLSVTGASGGVIYLVPASRTNVTVTYQDGVIVQSSNKAARLIGTYLTGAGGVSGQTEYSSVRQWIFNQKDAALSSMQSTIYNAIGSSSAIQSTIGAMENNLTMYTVSGSPLADSSNTVATLYGGGMYTNVQTFYNGSSGFYNELVGQFPITITGTAGIPEDVYIQGGGIGSTSVTVTEVAWANATTPPSRGTDPAGRLCSSTNSAALLLGAYDPVTSTTVQDNTGARLVSGALIRRPRAVLAKDTTNTWTTTSTTPVAANGSTVNGTGQLQVFTCVQCEPVSVRNFDFCGNSASGNFDYILIALDGTVVAAGIMQAWTTSAYEGTSCSYSASQIGLHTYARQNSVSAGTGTFQGGIYGFMEGTCWN